MQNRAYPIFFYCIFRPRFSKKLQETGKFLEIAQNLHQKITINPNFRRLQRRKCGHSIGCLAKLVKNGPPQMPGNPTAGTSLIYIYICICICIYIYIYIYLECRLRGDHQIGVGCHSTNVWSLIPKKSTLFEKIVKENWNKKYLFKRYRVKIWYRKSAKNC